MIEQLITKSVSKACVECFGTAPDEKNIQVQKTKREFEGNLTIVVFPLLKISRKSPVDTAQVLGEFLQKELEMRLQVLRVAIMRTMHWLPWRSWPNWPF